MTSRGINDPKRSWLKLIVLASSIGLALNSWAQDADTDGDEDEESSDLDRLVVTGSRIGRTDVEGPSPVTVLTADEIEREGFTTVYEALKTLTQNASFGQTEGDGGTFTQNANAVDLRGLGPGRTLILFNGRRATDYPLPFNGQSNLVNLSALPAVAIERIEILSGGASAIYGSDAVAGVINIIMKSDLEGHTVGLRYGDTERGGGETKRLQASGGWNGDRWNFTYAAEFAQRDPIWARDRDFMDSLADNPQVVNGTATQVNTRTGLVLDGFDQNGDGLTYVDPGPNACDGLPEMTYSFRPGRGNYCGRAEDVSQFTFRSERENLSVFTNFSFELTDDLEFFGNVNYWSGEAIFTTGTPFWFSNQTGGQFVVNSNAPDVLGIGGRLELLQRVYSLEELGDDDANANRFDEEATDIALGLRGVIADRFDWEFTASQNSYDVDRERTLQLRAAVDNFFLGPQTGVGIFGFPVHAAPNNILQPFTASDWASITGTDKTVADSSNEQFSFVISGDLFDLPAGPVGFAAIAEYGSQDYTIDLDDRFGTFDPDTGATITPNQWWGFTATGGGGERDRQAAGIELGVPLHDTLRLSLASRYDKYDDVTEVDDAVTYNAGLEWRPTRNFLGRAQWATSFRAPDMHFVFAGPSGFFTSVTDEYRCRRDEPGVPFAQCTVPTQNIFGQRVGNTLLKEEEGESLSVGFVWEIMDGLSISADYYDIELEDVVGDLSLALVLEREAECRLGTTVGGQAVDPNSLECRDALNRITREPINGTILDENIRQVNTGPINRSVTQTTGVDATVRYTLDTDRFGTWSSQLQWSHVLSDESAEFAGDPLDNDRDDLQSFNWRSRLRGSVTWNKGDFTTTLFGIRNGSLPNWAETFRTGPSMNYNLTMQYQIADNQQVGLFIQNVLDTEPTVDDTFNAYPYFLFRNFDPTGREWFLQYQISFNGN